MKITWLFLICIVLVSCASERGEMDVAFDGMADRLGIKFKDYPLDFARGPSQIRDRKILELYVASMVITVSCNGLTPKRAENSTDRCSAAATTERLLRPFVSRIEEQRRMNYAVDQALESRRKLDGQPLTGPVIRDAYGPGIHMDKFGRPVRLVPNQ